ncbi:MAG TPA: phage holin family protein [Fimbriimonadaceae bacterium]|jgi:putative membrane protein
MGRLLLRWILLALSVVVASFVTKALGLEFIVKLATAGDFLRLLIGVAILSLVNATLGRLLKLLTLPLNCLTLGLFSLVVNAVILMLVASLEIGFTIQGSATGKFLTGFVGSLLISVVNGVLGTFVPDKDEDE